MRPPFFLFFLRKERTRRARCKKEKSAIKNQCVSALRRPRNRLRLRSRRCLVVRPASQRSNVREETHEPYKVGRGNRHVNS